MAVMNCTMIVFVNDISNVKKFLSDLTKYGIHNELYWKAIHYGVAIEINFLTKNDYVEQIKNDYQDIAYTISF